MMLSGFLAKPCLADEISAPTSQAALSVEVTNGTENGATVENDLVIVSIYEDGQLLRTLDGKVNTDGKAVFGPFAAIPVRKTGWYQSVRQGHK